ncbi:MAG: hypothetical protein JXB88_05840 [Spirochaetales bacterium]|nr:hypothetical protein [Spirochaetales bacterium]
MDTVVPQSSSVILRSTHIVKVKIITSKPDSWEQQPEKGLQKRTTHLELEIIEQLKGEVREEKTKPVAINVTQCEGITLIRIPIPGVWSEKPIDKGLEYLLFCYYIPPAGSSSQAGKGKPAPPDARDVLCEEHTIMVLPVEKNESNVKLVMKAEKDKLSLLEFLDTLTGQVKELNPLFAEYAGTRTGELVFADWEGYKKWMALQENPDLDLKTRVILIEAMLHKLQLADPGIFEFYSLAVINLFRILRLPGTELIHVNILQTYLPNLLGLTGAGSYKPAVKIFEQNSNERKLALNWLSDHMSIKHTLPIREWIEKELNP